MGTAGDESAPSAQPRNLAELERLAQSKLSPGAWAYYSGGAGDEHTLREASAAVARYRFNPRVLRDVSTLDTSVRLLGRRYDTPLGLAPTAQHGLAHPAAEAETARGAAQVGALYCASTSSSLSCEAIAQAAPPGWFQLYVQDGAGPGTERLLARALSAGYQAIVLTVDLPVSGRRERELLAGFAYEDMHFGNFASEEVPAAFRVVGRPAARRDAFTFSELRWLRERCPVPLVVKGVLRADDAEAAVAAGVDAVWVSTHGGRQLDRSVAAIDALSAVVDRVGGHCEVYVDGGIRRGIDVATALCLGARAVFVGRPVLHALAWGGAEGVVHLVQLLRGELENTMALLGAPSVKELSRDLLHAHTPQP